MRSTGRIEYRRAVVDDAASIQRVARAALNDLNRRHGFAEVPEGPASPFIAFTIVHEGDGCSVAVENDTVVGVAISTLRQPVWFLAYLFVDPACQTRGVGRQLLARALAYGGDDAEIRALITPAYNPASIGLYMRHGMMATEPLYVFSAATKDLRPAAASTLKIEVLAPDADTAVQLAAIDRPILEMDRLAVHRHLLQRFDTTCHVFRAGGRAVQGYAYISASGSVGPVAAVEPLSFIDVLETALTRASEKSAKQVSVLLAGTNAPALALITRRGLRVTQPLLLMSSRRFGDLTRYGFHAPGLM